MSKITTELFIEKAKLIHGDKYDYSKVEYKGRHEKINIICKKHEEFIQEAGSHLRGYGCKLCTEKTREYKLKFNTKEFIQKAIKIHGDRYDYSKVNYQGINKKIIIICKIHGEFLQNSSKHLQGSNCKKCIIECMKSNNKEFIEKSKLKHGNIYDYSKVNYQGNNKKIIIICKIHGEFKQTPASHLKGSNCQTCSGNNKSNTQEFIKKSIQKHGDKYDYSLVDYKNCESKVIIVCKKHSDFEQTPNNHLNGHGCSKCGGTCKSNTQEFVEKSKLKHGEKYDYSIVI